MIPSQYATLSSLLYAQLAAFPEHRNYLERRFAGMTEQRFAFAEDLAQIVARVIGSQLAAYAQDYRWLAHAVIEEEIVFRRTGRYRLSSFAEAEREVYSNHQYMTRYMNGLLMSQLWWRNHTEVMQFFRDVYLPGNYLPGNPSGFDHLEIGPGHGLFLYYAALAPGVGDVAGWDISEASVERVEHTFEAIGLDRPVALQLVNMFDAPPRQFHSITFSEVLEHLEQPKQALDAIFGLLAPGGRAFINAPVNSPAPDHLTLFSSPEEIVDLVAAAGFEIVDTLFSPTSDATLERARKLSLAISTVVIARKPQVTWMPDPAIFEKLTECVRTLFDEYEGPVTPELDAHAVKQWDSLANVHLMVMIERAFGLRFTTEEIQNLANLGQLADLVAKKKSTA